mmetsp:Transcript_2322/g.6246  ORF Transcript_2322/g.6246 Transcript_2322/m.6246 type:complete len:147 (-) Transcript_2322:246-686(-)
MDLFSEVGLGGRLHLGQHKARDLLGAVDVLVAVRRDADAGLSDLVGNDIERDQLLVRLHRGVGIIPSYQALHVVYRVLWIDGSLMLCGVTHQAFVGIGECDDGRSDAISLVVGDDLSGAVFDDRDTTVGRTEIYSDDGSFRFLHSG